MTTIRVRFKLVLLLLSTGVVWSAAAATAQTDPQTAEQQGQMGFDYQPTYAGSFDNLWIRYLDAERRGDEEQKTRFLEEIRRLRSERNTFYLHDIALAFSLEACLLLEQGELDRAEENFRIALELDPTLPPAHHGLAQVAAGSGALGPITSLGSRLQGLMASFRSPRNTDFAWADLGLFLILLLSLVFCIFAVLLLYRYAGLLFHDLGERFQEKIGGIGVFAFTLLLLLLPLMLTFGFGWLVPYWLFVTFAYQSWRERSLTISALVLLFLVAPLIEFHAIWSTTLQNPLYRSSLSSVDGSFEPTDTFILQAAFQDYQEDRDLQLLIATQFKNLGEYELSASRYRAMLERWPDDIAARINLGNIYFAQRDWEGAVLEYDRAISQNASSAIAFYNKSLAHAENFEFREREAARVTAEDLNSRLVSSHDRRTGEYRSVIDIRLGPDEIYAKHSGLAEGLHDRPVVPSWTDAWLSGRGGRFMVGALILGALILLLEKVGDRDATRHCWKCGSAFCGRCQIGTGRRGLCTPCYHLFVVRDGVSSNARQEKEYQVMRSNRTRGLVFRILSIVAPGAGHIVEETAIFGFVLLFFWIGSALLLWEGSRFYGLPDDLMGLHGSLPLYPALIVMLVVIIAANTVAQGRSRG